MIKFNIKHDIKAAQRLLGSMAKQIPFATSLAINKTTSQVLRAEVGAMVKELENPTKGTLKGVRAKYSKKRDLTASVFLLPHVHKYLKYQINGGVRRPTGKVEAVPFNIKLNKFGNIVGRHKGKINKLRSKPNTFSGTIKGVAGLWQRMARGKIKLLLAYEKVTRYHQRYDFYKHASREANKRWPHNFRKAIKQAVRTAR